ncbi:LacI family DNA-binding transcriptional regulator [Persicobacter diffluens]|uniref:Transcriptional regulator n=1 Tax=Persicobacter diffluens TaxID=981 RepID=A0AAN4W460_9BACT|nr:transcriptional regulator [Persicobacter diffluens]
MTRRKSVRLQEIAERANVSIGTVDRVLHNRGRVSYETKAKIIGLVEELGYIHKNTRPCIKTVGVLCPRPEECHYWELPLRGIDKTAELLQSTGLTLKKVYFDAFCAEDYFQRGLELLNEHVDAVILTPLYRQESYKLVREMRKSGILYGFMDANFPELEPDYFVGQDAKNCGALVGGLIKYIMQPSEQVWVVNLSPGKRTSTNLQREIGAVDTLGHFFSHEQCIHVLDFPYAHLDRAAIFKKIEEQTKHLSKPRVVYVTNSRIKLIHEYFAEIGMAKGVIFIGHDPLPENISLLLDDKIDFLIAQDSVQQGSDILEGIWGILQKKVLLTKEKHHYSMVYTKDNIHGFLRNK